MRSRLVGIAVLAASVPLTSRAAEVVVEPGQTVSLTDIYEERWPPPGILVAERTIPFQIDFRPAWESTLNGSLSNVVVRRDDGGLTFGYRVSAWYPDDETVSLELSGLKVRGFAGSRTGAAREDSDQHLEVLRSADGGQLEFRCTSIGNTDPPIVWVNTDARSFDAGGSADWTATDDFMFDQPDGWVWRSATGTAQLTGLYQPALPEPAAALVVLAGGALVARRRSRRLP